MKEYKFKRVDYDYVLDIPKNVKITISGVENVSFANAVEERLSISQGKLEEYYSQEKKIAQLEKEIKRLKAEQDFDIRTAENTYFNGDKELVVCIPLEEKANRIVVKGSNLLTVQNDIIALSIDGHDFES